MRLLLVAVVLRVRSSVRFSFGSSRVRATVGHEFGVTAQERATHIELLGACVARALRVPRAAFGDCSFAFTSCSLSLPPSTIILS